jgi:hypothetical protein
MSSNVPANICPNLWLEMVPYPPLCSTLSLMRGSSSLSSCNLVHSILFMTLEEASLELLEEEEEEEDKAEAGTADAFMRPC